MARITAEEKAIGILKQLKGLGKDFRVLSEKDKHALLKMPEEMSVVNKGFVDALSRDVTIALSHNEWFRPPPCALVLLSSKGKIIGDVAHMGKRFYGMTHEFDTYILPPIPFQELDGVFEDVVSSSPGYAADKFLRSIIKVEERGATLLVGFNLP